MFAERRILLNFGRTVFNCFLCKYHRPPVHYSIYKKKSLLLTVANPEISKLTAIVLQLRVPLSSSAFLQNYYEVLGITPDASKQDIKAAYIELSKVHHPDKLLKDYEGSSAKDFLQIKEAFDVLSNDNRRFLYDLQTFKRSSDLNRFSTGEYKLYGKDLDTADFKDTGTSKNSTQTAEEEPVEDAEVDATAEDSKPSPLRSLLSLLGKVYAGICVAGLAFYILGKRYRRKE